MIQERIDPRDIDRWPVDEAGYRVCPACGAQVHEQYRAVHLYACPAVCVVPTEGDDAKDDEGSGTNQEKSK